MASIAEIFRPEPLPRLRAVTSLTCGGASLLAGGGMLEYATGSPAAQGTAVTSYWALFFAVHFVAFGGAALIGAFPRLARPAVKAAWAAVLVAVYVAAFVVWSRHQTAPEGPLLGAWLARNTGYVPAAVAFAIGLLWSSEVPSDDAFE